jgi:membrane protease YdiL (CAAX protease family)
VISIDRCNLSLPKSVELLVAFLYQSSIETMKPKKNKVLMFIRSLFWNDHQRRLRALWRLLIFLLIAAISANLLVFFIESFDNEFLEATLVNPVVALAFFVALWFSVKYTDRRPLQDFGLRISANWWREAGIGFGIGAAVISLEFLVLWIAGWVEVRGTFHTSFAAPFLVAFLAQLVRYAAGSFFEELMTRSYLLRIVAEGISGKRISHRRALLISWIVTSAIFGVLHLFNPSATWLGALNITLLGMLFGLGMIYTGRLALPIGLHMAWNVFQNNIFGLPNSGKPANTALLLTEVNGPELLTGGQFGLEGSLLSLVAVALGGYLVWLWLRRSFGRPELKEELACPPGINTDH